MTDNFIRVQIPNTLIGAGAVSSTGDTVRKFASTKILVITDRGVVEAGIIDTIKASLEKIKCDFNIFDGCLCEPPINAVEELSQAIKDNKYDLLIGVGGGSTMDTTKLASQIAANDGIHIHDLIKGKIVKRVIPKILVPTTSGTGSEWSRTAVVTDDKENGRQKLVYSDLNFPDAVIIDPELTLNLPPGITADTAMDALTHAVEAYTSRKANVFSDMLAGTAIKLIANNLRPAYIKGNKNIEARYNLSIAASLAMHSVVVASAGLAHYMNSALGERTHISHGKACTLLLPHVMLFNLRACPSKFAGITELMGENINGLSVQDAAQRSVAAIRELIRYVNMPQKLSDVSDIEISEAEIAEMAEEVHISKRAVLNKTNPRQVKRKDTIRIYTAAVHGQP